MKNMKRITLTILTLIVVFALSVSMVACQKDGEEPGKTDAPAVDQTGGDQPSGDKLGEIHVYTRDSSSGTREGFEGVVGFKGELTDKANEVASNGEMANQVGSDTNGIGYVSLVTNFEENHLKPLSFNGVVPTVESTVAGDYTLARPFCYVTRASGTYESTDKEELVKAFLAFINESTEGKEVIAAAGGIVDMNNAKPWDEVKADYPVVDQDNSGIEIVTGGSTSVEKAIKAALEAFQSYAGNFKFSMAQTGSSAGWERTLGPEKDGPNKADIGFASRNFKDEEPTADAIEAGTFCQDAIVAVVHADNHTVDDVSVEQLRAIFTGAVTEWDDVSGVK